VASIIGLLYGLSLSAVGGLLTGAGHGTYILLGIASAPISFLGIIFSLVSPPLLWGVICGLLPYTSKNPQRRIFISVVVLHYASVPFVIFFDAYSDLKYLHKVWQAYPASIIAGVSLYFAGQVLIWTYYLSKNSYKSQPYRRK